jgi:RecA/RadA recombinase
MEILQKRYGNDSIHSGNEMLAIERIPVDSPSIMRITSGPGLDGKIIGGIPVGRVTRIYGGESTGKTRLGWNIIANAQRYRSERFPDGLTCVYWNVEKQYDPVFVSRFGVDVEALKIEENDIIEDIAASMELLLRSRHLHIIDSASFANSLEELLGKEGGKNPEYQHQVAAHARAWKFAINRIHHAMDKDENIVVIIDHVGMKNVANGRAQVEEPLSGRRMRFRSDLSLHFRAGSWLFHNKYGVLVPKDAIKEETGASPEGMKSPDGQEISVIVAKSRVCRPLRTAVMRFDLRRAEFDTAFEYAEWGTYYDADGNLSARSGKSPLIVKSGNFYKPPGYTKSFNGAAQIQAAIAGDPILQQTILSSMLRST